MTQFFETETEDKEVGQVLPIPSITFVTETPQATHSDIAMPVKLFRRDKTHDSVIVLIASESNTAGRISKTKNEKNF